MYLLNDLPPAQEALWEMLVRKAVELLPLGLGDFLVSVNFCGNMPIVQLDLADAALIRIAEREGIRKIFTVGSETSRSTGFMVGSVPQSSLDPRT